MSARVDNRRVRRMIRTRPQMRDVRPRPSTVPLLACAALSVACGAVYRPADLRAALNARAPEQGKQLLDAALTDSRTGRTKESGRDTGRLLLERASLQLALGEFVACADDLARADRLLDRQAMIRSRYLTGGHNGESMVYMFERGWSQALNLPYGVKFYERLLLNPLAALCRLEASDPAGACTESRRFGVMADWTERVASGRARPVRAFGELVSTLSCAGVDPSLSCASLARARRLAPELAAEAHVACDRVSENSARLSVFVAYGRPSHPFTEPEKPKDVALISGSETRAERVRVRVDGRELEAPEVLDVDAAVRADFHEGMHALRVTFLGQTALVGGWSDTAWETLPAHIHLGTLDLSPGPHDVEVTVRGETRSRHLEVSSGEARTSVFFAPF